MSPARALRTRATVRFKAHSKYGARVTTVDGIRFHSAAESRRYSELKLLEKAGQIRGLVLQPSYPLDVFGVESRPIGIYRADFAFEERLTCPTLSVSPEDRWQPVVEDVKGFATALYKWKKKHVEAQYGIVIREIRRR